MLRFVLTMYRQRIILLPSKSWKGVRPFSRLSDSISDFRKDKSAEKVHAMVGHNFPDFIEWWNRKNYKRVGNGLIVATVACAVAGATTATTISAAIPTVVLGSITAGYWYVGTQDIQQTSHAIRRNYPVIGNLRYILETVRPEIRQYIVESDNEGRPYDRLHRSQIYQRSKNVDDTMPFGTRRNVYDVHHEWACHSMWPVTIESEEAKRFTVGVQDFGTTKAYSASILNVSAMSYGAISDNAIVALNSGAKFGNFYHNTGEGGVSTFHLQGGGDIVWNIGTGYFGCGLAASDSKRIFDPAMFQSTIAASEGRIKMIEIKLSQGAKPGHGGLLPKAKISQKIAQARRIEYPPTSDCHSPARHSEFSNPYELIGFIEKLRSLSGGLPVGIKLCVGDPGDIADLCLAILETGNGPDFITVDGAEGGTGAAPPELSNSVGLPLEEGIVVVRNFLIGAGLKDKIAIIASGRISTGFSIVRTIALGANITNAARAFMMSLGCIQALKCNTNKCPTGIATLNTDLMYGLDPAQKSIRVYNFHTKTVQAATDIVGILGKKSFQELHGSDIMRRVSANEVKTLSDQFPIVEDGCLLKGTAPTQLQDIWNRKSKRSNTSTKLWIY